MSLSLALSGVTPAATSGETGSTRCVPIRQAGRGLAVVPVEIEGAGVHPFLLDTGSDPTLIDRRLADELRLPKSAPITLVTTNGQIEVKEALTSVAIAGLWTRNLPVVPAPLDAIRAAVPLVQGVLGQDVLSRSSWLLDNRQGILVLDVDGSLASSLSGDRLPVRWSKGRPAIEATFGRTPVTLVLDSAATTIVLFERPASGTPAPPIRLTTLADVRSSAEAVRVDALRVGSSAIARPVAAIVPRQKTDDDREDGLLPTALFDAVYFDRARNEVVLQPASTASRPSIGSCIP